MLSLSAYQTAFQNYLTSNQFDEEPKELYEPINYILSLGGKRVRPLLALMGCHAVSENHEQAFPIAMAVEVFHNFTLLHDDIMDAAPLRRGMATVHEKYGINTGILSGDAMLILAYDYLAKIENKQVLPNLITIFNKMAIEVCQGQQLDMNFETRQNVAIEEYIRMIELKTAVLIAAAFKMGALVGGATEEVAEHLSEFGRNVGIAFQIQDDVLDTFGDPAKFGKKVGGDIVQNKKTYLVLKTLELGNTAQKEDLNRQMSIATTDESLKIEQVRSIFQAVSVRQYAESDMDFYMKTAFTHLDETPLSIETKNYLILWANALMQRDN